MDRQTGIRIDKCILECFKIMDTSVYFTDIYSIDTQMTCVSKISTCVSDFLRILLENLIHKGTLY